MPPFVGAWFPGFPVGGDGFEFRGITDFILFGLGGKMGSFGILVSASLAKELESALRLGFLGFVGFTKKIDFVENKSPRGFEPQTRGITEIAAVSTLPM